MSPQVPPDRCLVFDPAFSELEVAALGELGLRLLPENEVRAAPSQPGPGPCRSPAPAPCSPQEGKHQVRDSPTLFYMVHCGKALYNNLLWRNWAPAALSNMVIIGNSFKGMQERCAAPPRSLPSVFAFFQHFCWGCLRGAQGLAQVQLLPQQQPSAIPVPYPCCPPQLQRSWLQPPEGHGPAATSRLCFAECCQEYWREITPT